MGFLAGFGDRDIKILRRGYCYKISLVPEPFYAEVHAPGYAEGLSVYHNPRAKIPLPPHAFPGAAHITPAAMAESSAISRPSTGSDQRPTSLFRPSTERGKPR